MVDDGTCTRDGITKEYSTWNPVLFTDPKQGTLYLWYKITGEGPKPGYQNWWGAVRTSSDHGKTWSDRIWLPQVPNKLDIFKPYHFHATGPVKNHPIILPDGRLLCGSSTESPAGWRTHFEIYEADDWTGQKHGVSVIGPLEGRGIQASFIVLSSDYKNLRAFTRDDGITSSHDGGKSWSPITKSPVTTSKGFHAVTTKEGWHFLVFNKDRTRTPLGLARSKDGENWEVMGTCPWTIRPSCNQRMAISTSFIPTAENLSITSYWILSISADRFGSLTFSVNPRPILTAVIRYISASSRS